MADSYNAREILANNIKNARKRLDMTQAALAKQVQVSLTYIADIEHSRTWISDKTLIKLADSLKLELYQLFLPKDSDDKEKSSAKYNTEQADLIAMYDKYFKNKDHEIKQIYEEINYLKETIDIQFKHTFSKINSIAGLVDTIKNNESGQ